MNSFPSGSSSHYLKAASPLLGLLGNAVTLYLDQGNVEEIGMNIANLSLDSVGEKAQGIHRVLISIVNREEGEQEEGKARMRGCMCERDEERIICFILFLLM